MIPFPTPALRQVIPVSPEDLDTLKSIQVSIDLLRSVMEKLVEKKYGIDLREDWQLDLETGALSRK